MHHHPPPLPVWCRGRLGYAGENMNAQKKKETFFRVQVVGWFLGFHPLGPFVLIVSVLFRGCSSYNGQSALTIAVGFLCNFHLDPYSAVIAGLQLNTSFLLFLLFFPYFVFSPESNYKYPLSNILDREFSSCMSVYEQMPEILKSSVRQKILQHIFVVCLTFTVYPSPMTADLELSSWLSLVLTRSLAVFMPYPKRPSSREEREEWNGSSSITVTDAFR